MNVGDILYFDGFLAHSSGNNTTKDEVRYSLVGMWNETSIKDFRAPVPQFIPRDESAKEYFKKKFREARIIE